jgi:phosphoribosylanthranilate isomerase
MSDRGPRLFQIKICGVRTSQDVQAVIDAGGDAIGLNFFPKSSRYLADDAARELLAGCDDRVCKVGVFVNESAETIRARAQRLALDWIQLHGDEPPELLRELTELRVLRAFRYGADGLQSVVEYLDRCQQLGCPPAAVLLDAARPGQYGGSGQPIDWALLQRDLRQIGPLTTSWVLAGGLTPDNVAQAIQRLRPMAVDTASGVERSPGVKDPQKIAAFIRAARQAFGSP